MAQLLDSSLTAAKGSLKRQMSARSILYVSQLAPPSTLVAARRVAGFTNYLARLGHRVTVLTSRVSGEGEIDGAHRVVRTNDLMLTRLNWRRGHFEAFSGEGKGGYKRPSVLERVFVPDLALATWTPFALGRGVALARQERFDCVISSSPPESAHVVGLALRRHGICWIADLRDGWTFEPQQPPWRLALQRRADSSLERRVARKADALIAVTEPIAEDLRRRFGARVELITNGFDPEEAVDSRADGLLDPGRHSLVHTGRMAAARSSPEPLLAAIRQLKTEAPAVSERLEVVFAGPLSAEEQELLGAPDLDGHVRSLGQLPRPRALALQRAADSLLVVTEGSRRRSVATGKLFEYLAAGKPVLVLGEETEAARIVTETGSGFAASATDPTAIAAALRRLVEASSTDPPSTKNISRYSYPELAERLSALIEDVCGR
jgi:glycosyltransferase involved in cell wall biosynthesis